MTGTTGKQPRETADIILLAGFLGCGKTTLLKQILSWESDLSDTVVLVNEFGKVGIDGALLKDSGSDLIELTNGCICCTLSADLHQALMRLWKRFKPRRILIEASGIADPKSITTVLRHPEICQHMELRKIMTVLEADIWGSREVFGQLFYNQLEMADLILLNKIDLMATEQISQFLDEIHDVIPDCQVVPTIHCAIDPETLWTTDTPKSDGLSPIQFFRAPSNRISVSPGTLSSRPENAGHTAGAVHYETFSFQSSKILDEACFNKFIHHLPWELFRIKGPVQFADRVAMLNFVGGKSEYTVWDGNPETRLVFVGWGIDQAQTIENLKKCTIDSAS
ncbi:MAG: GTP-binding protein [Desulfobacterales bacterium]|jgi:G3E family GTPase